MLFSTRSGAEITQSRCVSIVSLLFDLVYQGLSEIVYVWMSVFRENRGPQYSIGTSLTAWVEYGMAATI